MTEMTGQIMYRRDDRTDKSVDYYTWPATSRKSSFNKSEKNSNFTNNI